MRIITVYQRRAWQGYGLDRAGRVRFVSGYMPSEFLARRAASLWLLKQQGRAA